MKHVVRFGVYISGAVMLLAACSGSKKTAATSSLKDACQNDFLTGTALNAEHIEEKDLVAAALVPVRFNALMPGNIIRASSFTRSGIHIYPCRLPPVKVPLYKR